MLNKSHRSVVSTCVLIFMPYFKKTIKKKFSKKKLVFFFAKKTRSEKKKHFFFHITTHKTRDISVCCKGFQQCRVARNARAGSTPPVALKMSSREGLGAMPHGAKLHRLD